MSTEHPTELLPALALGCLQDNEQRAVRNHVSQCDTCRRHLAALQDVTLKLAFGAPTHSPPAQLHNRLMARIDRRHRRGAWLERWLKDWPRLIPAGILAGMILLLALGAGNILLWLRMDRAGTRVLEHARMVWLLASERSSAAVGTLIMTPDGQRAVLVLNAMTPLAPDHQYQLWLIKNGRRTSGGVFSVSNQGRATLMVVADRPMDEFDAFGITIEPFGGSPGPTGKKVLGGKV